MNKLLSPLKKFFSPPEPIPAGIYHYQAPPDDPRNYRLHLRIEKDGSAVLILNAATILHLNQTAAEYAYYLVKNQSPEQAASKMAARYTIDKNQARQDYQNLIDRIQTLVNTPDLDPVTFLDFERQVPFSGQISAPYRLDCALTYRLSNEKDGAAPTERVDRELTTNEWKNVIDKAWHAGIPHLIFTGGEPTLRQDLPKLIAYGEANNQVTGLISDGFRLAEKAYLDSLLQTGLDHIMFVLHPSDQAIWQALDHAIPEDIFIAVHLTITQENQEEILKNTINRLADRGVHELSLSASDIRFQESLEKAQEKAASLGLELVWNLPVPYSALHPIALENKNFKEPTGAGKAILYVEPDGDVLPAQGVNHVLGNMVNDPWGKIWANK